MGKQPMTWCRGHPERVAPALQDTKEEPMTLSARNQLSGTVKSVVLGT
jgi:hypothetical protein